MPPKKSAKVKVTEVTPVLTTVKVIQENLATITEAINDNLQPLAVEHPGLVEPLKRKSERAIEDQAQYIQEEVTLMLGNLFLMQNDLNPNYDLSSYLGDFVGELTKHVATLINNKK